MVRNRINQFFRNVLPRKKPEETKHEEPIKPSNASITPIVEQIKEIQSLSTSTCKLNTDTKQTTYDSVSSSQVQELKAHKECQQQDIIQATKLSICLNSLPLIHHKSHIKQQSKQFNYDIHNCVYQSVIRTLLWYRNSTINQIPIHQPYEINQIHMVDKTYPWKEWITRQSNFSKEQNNEIKVDTHPLQPTSFPSWNKWKETMETFYKTHDNEKNIYPTIQGMMQWLFDTFTMGCIVIPKLHITTCLMIDSTFLLEWPFVFAVKQQHVYPIINSSCAYDWIDKPSFLENHYIQIRSNHQTHNLTSLKNKNIKEQKINQMTCKYDCLYDKETRLQLTLGEIQTALKQVDYVLVPFWDKTMMETLRRALFRMMRNEYAKKSQIFPVEWASRLEQIFSFYEHQFLFL